MEFLMNILFNSAYTISEQYPTSAGSHRATSLFDIWAALLIPTRIIWILVSQAPANNKLN